MQFSSLIQYKSCTWMSIIYFFVLAIVVTAFHSVSFYYTHFFDSGWSVSIYQVVRVFFIFSFIILFYSAGDLLLCCFFRSGMAKDRFSTILLKMLMGLGILQLILFIMGLAGLLRWSLMAGLVLVLTAMTLPAIDRLLHGLVTSFKENKWQFCLLFLPALLFFVTKGLYPAGGHDYYNHYFPFYREVVESGVIKPNNVWYHFFYSKGDALFFLSMLLTDPLGPQLMSTAVIMIGAALVYALLQDRQSSAFLPALGSMLYLLFLIYTPGPIQNLNEGGWGDLEKSHEISAVLMLSVIWLTNLFNFSRKEDFKVVSCCLFLTVCALLLMSEVMAVVVGCYFLLTLIHYQFKGRVLAVRCVLSNLVLLGVFFTFIIGINYFYTGIPSDQVVFKIWPVVDIDKVKNWGVLYELMMLHYTKSRLALNQLPITLDTFIRIFAYLRMDVWRSLLLAIVVLLPFILLIPSLRFRFMQRLNGNLIALLSYFLLFVAILSIIVGRIQYISFYRFTSFTYAMVLVATLLILGASLLNRRLAAIALTVIILFSWVKLPDRFYLKWQPQMSLAMSVYDRDKLKSIIKNSVKLALGRYSLADAYVYQKSWPGRMPWGGVYPAAESVWRKLPAKTRVWSFHVHSYCMLPDCRFEGFMSFSLGKHADQILFGSPAIAKQYLQKAGLNYFFISNSLQLADPLPLTSLFNPEHIRDYLGVEWTDGESALLTWKENATEEINSEWLSDYYHRVKSSDFIGKFPYKAIRQAFSGPGQNGRIALKDFPSF